jgi:hypothetical protein
LDGDHVLGLEYAPRSILVEWKNEWSLKSRVLSIDVGDLNSKLFQSYVNHRKKYNTIWELEGDESQNVKGLKDLVTSGVRHFQTLF